MNRFFCYIKITFILLLTTSFTNQKIDEVRSYLIYNVAKNISFSNEKNVGKFVIGVQNDINVYNYLNKISKYKSVNGRKIELRIIKNPFEVIDCNLIVVPNDMIVKYNGICYVGNVLLFGYGEDALDKGAHVAAFINSDNKPRLKISIDNMVNCGISPHSDLIKLANNHK